MQNHIHFFLTLTESAVSESLQQFSKLTYCRYYCKSFKVDFMYTYCT